MEHTAFGLCFSDFVACLLAKACLLLELFLQVGELAGLQCKHRYLLLNASLPDARTRPGWQQDSLSAHAAASGLGQAADGKGEAEAFHGVESRTKSHFLPFPGYLLKNKM